MMTDEATGLMGRLGMTIHHARAYNSQAKGASERSHNIFTRAAKRLPTYVGKDMDAEARKAMFHWTRGEIRLQGGIINAPIPTWDGFKQYIEAVIAEYNDMPHRALPQIYDADGKKRHMTPNEFWAVKTAHFGQPPKVAPEDEGLLFRPQVMRTVSRGKISILNNTYFSAELAEFHGERLRVGYDVQDARWVWIYDDEGRLICKAETKAATTHPFRLRALISAPTKPPALSSNPPTGWQRAWKRRSLRRLRACKTTTCLIPRPFPAALKPSPA